MTVNPLKRRLLSGWLWFALADPSSHAVHILNNGKVPLRRVVSCTWKTPAFRKSPLYIRGGDLASENPSTSLSKSSVSGGRKKKKKRSKKVSGSKDKSKAKAGKDAINEAMHKDAATALGDAIRDRADELRTMKNPLLEHVDQSIYSVGWAMGASDAPRVLFRETSIDVEEADDAGVAGSPTSVLVSYFLKSHGGAHALQCICSLLASLAGFGCLVLSPKNPMKLVLLKRTLVFAMVKHVAGLLGATFVASKAIPEVGLRKARVWMEQLARDPVSQYVFYTACVLLWLPASSAFTNQIVVSGDRFPWIPLLLLGPVLLREAISALLVISDVLVLWMTSSSSSDGATQPWIQNLLKTCHALVNMVMCLLVTPQRWQNADSAIRQQLLAKITSKISLSLELVVGLVMASDALARVGQFVFGTANTGDKQSLLSLALRIFLARIYLQFLLSRKRKISKLATEIRGGAGHLPFYLLDALIDPQTAMGLSTSKQKEKQPATNFENLTWKDYLFCAFGLDE